MEFRLNTTRRSFQINTSKDCLIAVDESKGLIGIYDVKDGVVSIFNINFIKNNKKCFIIYI
jgi:hypothetical protein